MELSTLTRTLLFDTYGDMLTEKQRLCFDLRYNQDLSLGEIAELEGISRQAVRDNVVRTEALLQDMEQKIGAVARLTRLEAPPPRPTEPTPPPTTPYPLRRRRTRSTIPN